jgi:glycosyltransferase involved in cell wall biosynthesis
VLNQDFEDWELIIWDNRSVDETSQIARSFRDPRIKYYCASLHTTLGEARNLALDKSRGELIAFLDSDDLWLPNKLLSQVPIFDDQEIGLVYSDTEIFNDEGAKRLMSTQGRGKPPMDHQELALNYNISLESAIFRKCILYDGDLRFDTRYSAIEEYDLFVRIAANRKVHYIADVHSKWRVHQNSITWKKEFQFIHEEKIWIKEALESALIDRKICDLLLRKRLIKLWRFSLFNRSKAKSLQIIKLSPIPLYIKAVLVLASIVGPRTIARLTKLLRPRVTPVE